MSSGGGTTTTTQNSVSTKELPAWLDQAAQQNIARGQMVADIGYTPYYGLDTAGFSPMQTSGFQNTANAAAAFGLGAPADVNAYMPQTTTNNLGFTGYSSGNMFDSALSQLQANRPAQYNAIQSQFVDPWTGVQSAPTLIDLAKQTTDANAQAELLSQRPELFMTADDYRGADANADPISSAEAYSRAQAFLNPQTTTDKALRLAMPFFLTPFLDEIHKANIKQYEAEIAANEPFSGAYNLGGSGLTQNEGGGWTGSASDASRESGMLDSGTGSGIGSQGGNAANGFSFGGW
jgi:hypothetical protein